MSSKLFAFTLVASVLLGVALADSADDKFAACCKIEGVDRDCCKYPPGSEASSDSAPAASVGCLTEEGFPKFAKCANVGKDNTACCRTANVTEPLCLELCDGSKTISHNSPIEYATCSGVRGKIFECIQNANND